jgi:hypothetical protein
LFECESRIDYCAQAAGVRIHHEHGAFAITKRLSGGFCQCAVHVRVVSGGFLFLPRVVCDLCDWFRPRAGANERRQQTQHDCGH